jgi:hypothetical protein
VSIAFLLCGWIATGKPSPFTETVISVDGYGDSGLGWELLYFPTVAREARHEIRKPARQGGLSYFSDSLLGGNPPLFNQLLQYLPAIAQASVPLNLVKQSDRLAWQISNKLQTALGSQAAAIGAVFLAYCGVGRIHGALFAAESLAN